MTNEKIIRLLSSGNVDDISIGWELLLGSEKEWFNKTEDWFPYFDALGFSSGKNMQLFDHLIFILKSRFGEEYWKKSYIIKSYQNRTKAWKKTR